MINQSDLVELKYISEAIGVINISDLIAIVDVSITTNELHGITGILFFDKGYFGQILEGHRNAVEETWSRVKNDKRHQNLKLLGISKIQTRRFPKWSMKLFDAQEFAMSFPQISKLIATIADQDAETLRMMRSLWQEV
jgi:hypothetical protein